MDPSVASPSFAPIDYDSSVGSPSFAPNDYDSSDDNSLPPPFLVHVSKNPSGTQRVSKSSSSSSSESDSDSESDSESESDSDLSSDSSSSNDEPDSDSDSDSSDSIVDLTPLRSTKYIMIVPFNPRLARFVHPDALYREQIAFMKHWLPRSSLRTHETMFMDVPLSQTLIAQTIHTSFHTFYSRLIFVGHFNIIVSNSDNVFFLSYSAKRIYKTTKKIASRLGLPLPHDFTYWCTYVPNPNPAGKFTYSFGTRSTNLIGFNIFSPQYKKKLVFPFYQYDRLSYHSRFFIPWCRI